MGTYMFDLFLNPKGRINTNVFCLARIFLFFVLWLSASSMATAVKEYKINHDVSLMLVVSSIMILVTAYSNFVVDRKRLADMGRQGKFAAIGLVTGIDTSITVLNILTNIIFFLYLVWLSGTDSVLPIEQDEQNIVFLEGSLENLDKNIKALEEKLKSRDLSQERRDTLENVLENLKMAKKITINTKKEH